MTTSEFMRMKERFRTYAPEPTLAPPGTAEKEKVMCERWKEGYLLFHPADARYEGDPMPLEWLAWKEAVRREQNGRFFEKIKSLKSLENKGEESILEKSDGTS